MSFASFGLSEPLRLAIKESGYSKPTPIQLKAIPIILAGKDLMAAAQTGTGKTASFVLPLLQRLNNGPKVKANQVRILVLTPTRELAVQVAQNVDSYSKHLPLKTCVVYGGVKINPQMMKLRGGADLLVATPGRLLDLASQNAIKFSQLETLVLDEADRMLDMGFSAEVGKIMALLPKLRQTLLFSATISDEIRKLGKTLLNNPLQIDISPRNSTARTVKQWVIEVDKGKKPALLSRLIRNKNWAQVLVFTKTKKAADALVLYLKSDNISVDSIHGDKSQALRTQALENFKTNKTRILVATDIAARGLDINELPHVVNFDLPKVAEDYIHRIGRTGRAGLPGEGISLVSADEVKLLAAIETLIKQTLVREVETGFVSQHKVPLTLQTVSPAKKPKKLKLKQNNTEGKARPGNKSPDTNSSKGDKRTGRERSAAATKPRTAAKSRRNTGRNNRPDGTR
ncbi:MAG: DEAD/DEAH box helicase [Desulfuromonadaceae bacterium]|nr:DEAD/DEAH box helicase [Desulfuromonas sp.]MDY0184637.1 DEAD/DEAH box helicase [Desulfuromonadaceae bacterium]